MTAEVFPKTQVEQLNAGAAAAVVRCAAEVLELPYVHVHAGIEKCPDRELVKTATRELRLFKSKHWKVGSLFLLSILELESLADATIVRRPKYTTWESKVICCPGHSTGFLASHWQSMCPNISTGLCHFGQYGNSAPGMLCTRGELLLATVDISDQ